MHQMTLPMGDDSGSDGGPKPVPVHVGDVPVNSSVSVDDQKRLSGQSRDILEALRNRPYLNTELITLPTANGQPRLIHNMTARVREIRNYLRPQEWDVQSCRLPGGIRGYPQGRQQVFSWLPGELTSIGGRMNRSNFLPGCAQDVIPGSLES